MRTIKILGIEFPHELRDCEKRKTRPFGIGLLETTFVPSGETAPGYVRFQSLTPSWPKYVGIDLFPSQGNRIAFLDAEGDYYYFDGTAWAIAAEPVYQDIETIRQGLNLWAGELQVEAEVDDQLQYVAIAYDVDIPLAPYLLEYGIPGLLLSEPVAIVRRRRTSPTGKINLGQIDLESISRVVAHTPNGLSGEFTPDSRGTITTPWSNSVIEVKIELLPFCDFVFAEYQITRLPIVLLHLLPEERIRYPISTLKHINLGDGTTEETGIGRLVDMVVECRITADEFRDSLAIANQLFAFIRRAQVIEAAPFDEAYPVVPIGGVTMTEGLPPSATFRFHILNLPMETYGIRNLLISDIVVNAEPSQS